jgi:hypothetical protein
MTDFLNSLKADLLDRRMLPLLAIVAVCLLGAVGYVVLGGGSSSPTSTPTAAVAPISTASSGIAVSSQSGSDKALAETTSGVSVQRHGSSRNPFTPLPGSTSTTASAAAPTTTTKASGSSSTSSSSSGSSTPSGATSPSTPAKPVAPSKPATVYHVAVLFGVAPTATPEPTTQLTPYESLKLLTPLPSSALPLIVFRGVTVGGKSATFTLVGEAILRGQASCLPSASQCQEIDLAPGKSEQLEYLPSSGPAVIYELKVVAIASSKASGAAVKDVLRSESTAGRELLRHAGLVAIPYLHYSASQVGVLAFVAHPAFAARAHAAQHSAH